MRDFRQKCPPLDHWSPPTRSLIEMLKPLIKPVLQHFYRQIFPKSRHCRIDSNQRQRNETPLDSSKIISKTRLRRRESGQGKIRTLRTTEIPFYPLYPLTTVPLQSKIMYFHQLLWFLCYHFLSDFKITFTVTFFRSLLSTVDNVNFTRGNTVISPTGITVRTVILGGFEPFQTSCFFSVGFRFIFRDQNYTLKRCENLNG